MQTDLNLIINIIYHNIKGYEIITLCLGIISYHIAAHVSAVIYHWHLLYRATSEKKAPY
jgi:hypothetical protein